MNLWNLNTNETAVISAFADDLQENIAERLRELGLSKGESITCVMQPSFGAPRMFQVNQSVYSLDHELAAAILIEEIGD